MPLFESHVTNERGSSSNQRQESRNSQLGSNVSTQQAGSGHHLSSGETTKNKKRQLTRLDLLKRKSLAVIIIADIILVAALITQLLLLSHILHNLFSHRVADANEYADNGILRTEHNMRLGLTKYASNYSSTPACNAVDGDAVSVRDIHLLFLHERTNRQIEFLAVVGLEGGIISSAGPPSLNGHLFNPSGIISNYTELFRGSGQQMSVAIPVHRDLFAEMQAPEFRDDPSQTTLPTWNDHRDTFTVFIIQPLFCGQSNAQAYIVWGNAMTPSKYHHFNDVVDMEHKGFVALIFYDDEAAAFRTSSSYMKTSETDIRFPDVATSIPASELEFVVGSRRKDVMGTVSIEGTEYITSMKSIAKTEIGDVEIDLFPPRAVSVFGLPSGPVRATVNRLIQWHLPVMALIIVMSLLTAFLLIKKFVEPMQNLLESVKKKKISDFNESIRIMKSNRSFLWLFIAQALILEGVLAGLIVINRKLLEGVVSEFTSASDEGPEVAALLASKHHDIASYMQGWTGFPDIINQTASQSFSPETRQQLDDARRLLNISSISIIGACVGVRLLCSVLPFNNCLRNSLVLESTMRSSVGKPFPIDTLIDYFGNFSHHSARSIVTTQSWTLTELEHHVPIDSHASETIEPAVVKIMAAPIMEISEADNLLVEGGVLGAIIGIDLVNDQSSLLSSSLKMFGSGYFGIYAWNKAARDFKLLTSVYKKSSSDIAKFNILLDGGGHDILSRGISSSFSPDQLYVEEEVLIASQHHTVSIVPLVPLHEISFDECPLHVYVLRGVDNTEWLELLQAQSEFDLGILVVELVAVILVLVLTYWPMYRFLVSIEKTFSVPSLSQHERDKMHRRAATMMGLDSVGAAGRNLVLNKTHPTSTGRYLGSWSWGQAALREIHRKKDVLGFCLYIKTLM